MKIIQLNKLLNVKNNKIIITNIINTFFIKGAAMIVTLLSIPAYMNYFDNNSILGFWFTVLSVLTWILSFDLGIGNGLRNKLVESFVLENHKAIKNYISSAYIIIGFAILIVIMLFSLTNFLINWNRIFQIPNNLIDSHTLAITMLILVNGILIQIFLKTINSILYAMQKSFINNLNILISNILILIYIMTINFEDIKVSIYSISFIYILSVNIPIFFSTIIIFKTKLNDFKPNIKYFSKNYSKEILKLGLVFFWVQVMYMLLTTTNEFLISWFSQSDKVVDFQIYNRIFTVFGTIFSLTLIPIWSIVTKAFAEKNYIWIKKTYKVFVVLGVFVILMGFLLIPFLQIIFDIWLQDNSLHVNKGYAMLFAILGGMIVWIGVNNNFANGLGELKTQTIFFTLGVIIKVPLSWYFVHFFDSWIGVIIASILSLGIYCIVQPIWLGKHINKLIE